MGGEQDESGKEKRNERMCLSRCKYSDKQLFSTGCRAVMTQHSMIFLYISIVLDSMAPAVIVTSRVSCSKY